MKRVIVVSDSHGDVNNLREALTMAQHAGQINVLVFLGDGLGDFEAISASAKMQNPFIKLYTVRGNNDMRFSAPDCAVFCVNGVVFYACHGHEQHVKFGMNRLCSMAREHEAKVVLYGHTHCSHLEMEYGLHLINPGAICERMLHKPAYAEIRVEDTGVIKADLRRWE